MKPLKRENGYSLLEITVAIVIAGLVLAVGIPAVYNQTVTTAHKSGIQSDVTAVGIALAYQYPNTPPTTAEFTALKAAVLEDYITTETEYLNSISFTQDSNQDYCVEATKTNGGTDYTFAYSTILNKAEETTCTEINSRF